jgi:fimbrial chaperone protein
VKHVFIAACLLLVSSLQVAHAGVVVGGTRLVFKGAVKDTSIGLENTDKSAFLVQAWVEDEKGGDAQSVFLVTPPLFKMAPESASLLRVIKIGNLPEDRESLFWLNVRSIPSVKSGVDANQLTLSVQSRMKLIYRPQALLANTVDAMAAGLQWHCRGASLGVSNPTKYYMNFASVKVSGVEIKTPGWVAPGESKTFAGAVSGTACEVKWQVINDYGSAGQVHANTALKGNG